MEKLCNLIGKTFLAVAAVIILIGPASINGIAVEEMPDSIKSKR